VRGYESFAKNPVIAFLIKKRINTEQSIDGMAVLYIAKIRIGVRTKKAG